MRAASLAMTSTRRSMASSSSMWMTLSQRSLASSSSNGRSGWSTLWVKPWTSPKKASSAAGRFPAEAAWITFARPASSAWKPACEMSLVPSGGKALSQALLLPPLPPRNKMTATTMPPPMTATSPRKSAISPRKLFRLALQRVFRSQEVYQIPAVLFWDLAGESGHDVAEAAGNDREEEEVRVVGDVEPEVHGRHGQRFGQRSIAATGEAVALRAVLVVQVAAAGDGGIGGGDGVAAAGGAPGRRPA